MTPKSRRTVGGGLRAANGTGPASMNHQSLESKKDITKMEEPSPEESIMLSVAALYIALTEAIHETFGRDIEPAVNRLLEGMRPHLPETASDLVGYLLEFSSPRTLPPSSGGLFEHLSTVH